MSKTAPLSMRLDPDLKACLKKLAKNENRSLTNYIETALRELASQHMPMVRKEDGRRSR